jgi:predicted RNase H-like HicB family nuclease
MESAMSSVLCFAHGRGREWEAICVDFDIAVQGDSFDEVKAMLDEAVSGYIDAVMQEAEPVRARLLNRRAPWHVRATLTFKLIAFNIFRGRTGEAQASFPVLCPA